LPDTGLAGALASRIIDPARNIGNMDL
jgi:hypothetical protein